MKRNYLLYSNTKLIQLGKYSEFLEQNQSTLLNDSFNKFIQNIQNIKCIIMLHTQTSVSYTHLDVYKRQT